MPAEQMPVPFMTVLVRTRMDPASLLKPATAAIHDLDRGQPISRVLPMMQKIYAASGQKRFAAVLLGLFSALALTLAAVGVGGVMAYTVAQRTREFGIRMALGARTGQVLGSVLAGGLKLALIGVAAGTLLAWMFARLLRAMLYGVTMHDAVTFTAVPMVLFVVAAGACLLPARIASRVDPVSALRHD